MSEDNFRLFQKVNAAFDTPAFCRRGATVELAWETLHARCQDQRREFLEIPQLRLATFCALIEGTTHVPLSVISDADRRTLEVLNREWEYRLKVKVFPAKTEQQLRSPFRAVLQSFLRFNQRWQRYITSIDLTGINDLRDNYNRFYVIEKECALWSAKLAQKGFVPLNPIRPEDLFAEFPLLPVPSTATSIGGAVGVFRENKRGR
jgi:hypothetical protein